MQLLDELRGCSGLSEGILERRLVSFLESLRELPLCPELKGLEGLDPERCKTLLKVLLSLLRRITQEGLPEGPQRPENKVAVCRRALKSQIQETAGRLFRGFSGGGGEEEAGAPDPIHTELHLAEGAGGGAGHEAGQLETAPGPQPAVALDDLFKAPPGREEPVRTVLTSGVAGIGKTVLTQQLALDWARGRALRDVHFLFPLAFRELNLLRGAELSLAGLLHRFFPAAGEAGVSGLAGLRVVFVLDGLDESRLALDFAGAEALTDAGRPAPVELLLTSLIRGELLPAARLWITTRPAAAGQIPAACVGRLTEVRGFTDAQKEAFFRGRFLDAGRAGAVVAHVRRCRCLRVMCRIPVFCRISAGVLDEVLRPGPGGRGAAGGGEAEGQLWTPEGRGALDALGGLAFRQLLKGNLIFYESDLTDSGMDLAAASRYSGVFTQVFKEESELRRGRVFSFVHLSVQEFLAALHVHLTFSRTGVNLLEEPAVSGRPGFLQAVQQRLAGSGGGERTAAAFYRAAVRRAQRSPGGQLDMLLRFLLGLSLPSNQALLQGLLVPTQTQTSRDTVQYIREQIEQSPAPEKSLNLFHCLAELRDGSLLDEVQRALASGPLSDKLSAAQWSALVFVLLSSEADLDVFDLQKYSASEEALLRLLPVVKASRKAVLSFCNLSERGVDALASLLSSDSSGLRELDLSNHSLPDTGLRRLSAGLSSPDCKLETLRLSGCSLSDRSLADLGLPSGRLRELDLSSNRLLDAGVQLLTAGMQRTPSSLDSLRLSECQLSEGSCEALSGLLSSGSSSLSRLDLSNNNLRDSGVRRLSVGIGSPRCRLETLRLSGCLVTEEGCGYLASALTSNPSHLSHLDLSYNPLGESGEKLLAAKVDDPEFRLATLRVKPGGVQWSRPDLRKYSCELRVDANTVNPHVKLSEGGRRLAFSEEGQDYPPHADRFEKDHQLLCAGPLTGRRYWEVEVAGGAHVSVSCRGPGRSGGGGQQPRLVRRERPVLEPLLLPGRVLGVAQQERGVHPLGLLPLRLPPQSGGVRGPRG
ncbi:NLR family CARD domain-containing protein 3-like [Menidia menidia]